MSIFSSNSTLDFLIISLECISDLMIILKKIVILSVSHEVLRYN